MSRTAQLSRQQDHAARDVLTREWEANYSLDRHIAHARDRMGEARWADLNAEWDDAQSMAGSV